jgi:hypothetical protein
MALRLARYQVLHPNQEAGLFAGLPHNPLNATAVCILTESRRPKQGCDRGHPGALWNAGLRGPAAVGTLRGAQPPQPLFDRFSDRSLCHQS